MQPPLRPGWRQVDVQCSTNRCTCDVKMDKKWKYDDTKSSGCQINEETGVEIMRCVNLGDNDENISYKCFFKDLPEQIKAAKILAKKLKMKDKNKRRGDIK